MLRSKMVRTVSSIYSSHKRTKGRIILANLSSYKESQGVKAKSLFTLGDVIDVVTTGTMNSIPYDDPERRIIMNAMGRGSHIAILCCCSLNASMDECISTLHFSSRVNSMESDFEKQEITLNKYLYKRRNTSLKTELQAVKVKQIRAEEEINKVKLELEVVKKLLLAESKEEERYKENKDKEEKDKEKEKESKDKENTEKSKFLSLFMSIITVICSSFTISYKFEHVSAETHVSIAAAGALSCAFASVGLIITIYDWGRLSSIQLAFWMSFFFLTVYSCLGMASASKEAEKDNSVFWAMVISFVGVTIMVAVYAIWGVNFEGWVKSTVGYVKGLFLPSVKSEVVHPSSSTSPKKSALPYKDLELNNSCTIDF